ncbi:hypothetical protein [Luteitalea sp.]
MTQSRFIQIFREGLIIGGWVAMWRPLEIFLYDWWPVRADVRLYLRLSTMLVGIQRTQPGPASRTAMRPWTRSSGTWTTRCASTARATGVVLTLRWRCIRGLC